VLANPTVCTVDKTALAAQVELPALLPGINFFHRPPYSLYQVVAALGIVPDLFYQEAGDHYFPADAFDRVGAQTVETQWYSVRSGSPAATLSLNLPQSPAGGAYSLVLALGVQWGNPGAGGNVVMARKASSGRIERVV
jgi:hypothetical protein